MSTPVAVTLEHAASYHEWRAASRQLLLNGIAPEEVAFIPAGASADLFGTHPGPESPGVDKSGIRVPREFPELAKTVLCHNNDSRFSLLYRLLWRLADSPRLLDNGADPDVWAARKMAKSVRRDAHKMKAFVRFRKTVDKTGEAFVAWFEPDHHIVERTAPFFSRRFTGMRWSIVTPDVSAHWDTHRLTFSAGASRSDVPDEDALEDYWRVYYSSIFNPGRLKVNAMRAEMPIKYWKNLPESRLIPELTRSARKAQRAAPVGTAPSRDTARRLVALQPNGTPELSEHPTTLEQVAQNLQTCTRCNLCQHATAAVPGEGPASARLMIVGEQPGDREDLGGRPFIGPAGDVLNAALREAGIERDQVYLTNAVKHFKHTVRGKRRIHERPNASEIEHCRWWLNLERQIVSPTVTLALGATAARAVIGRTVKVNDIRGQSLDDGRGGIIVVTAHPASLLRQPDQAVARMQKQQFADDLKRVSRLVLASGIWRQPGVAGRSLT